LRLHFARVKMGLLKRKRKRKNSFHASTAFWIK
jgi:hypothetical protein